MRKLALFVSIFALGGGLTAAEAQVAPAAPKPHAQQGADGKGDSPGLSGGSAQSSDPAALKATIARQKQTIEAQQRYIAGLERSMAQLKQQLAQATKP